ncbi:MAG: glycerate kinase [Dehalococcoidia bacterium]|nr:glycerate kinase [Dehalococcoidia bacterium]
MKVLIAPNAFKGTLAAAAAADAMAEGVARAFPDAQVVKAPVADGGDGTLDVLVRATYGHLVATVATGPLGRKVQASWGVLGPPSQGAAMVESAQACGRALLRDDELDPFAATSRGVGEMVRAALDAGHRRIIVGVGGTATNDGGAGVAQALGARLLDAAGNELPPGGGALARLARIDLRGLDSRVASCELTVAADVTNPLCSPMGAAQTYGRQKFPQEMPPPGALEQLDQALARLDHVIRVQLGRSVGHLPGAGAGGGLGAGLLAFLGARIVSGAELVCDLVGIDAALDGADLVLTGEGRLDWQTAFGKAPGVVARRAAVREVPVIGVGGSLGSGYERLYGAGFARLGAIVQGSVTVEEALRNPAGLLAEATERVFREWKASPPAR